MDTKVIYNIYCDESCHLENDNQKVMVLGAIWCQLNKTKIIFNKLREIKEKHNLSRNFELKWNKVSPAKVNFYLDIVNYFFNEKDLHFRALIVRDKTKLKHELFSQDYDTWYYKMYFHLLNVIFLPYGSAYRVYIDIKDTCSSRKIKKLHEVLCNENYDFSKDIIERVQAVRSHEVEILQLADLFSGALAYINRNLKSSRAKLEIIERIKNLSGYSLSTTTLLREDKFNMFFWLPQEEVQ